MSLSSGMQAALEAPSFLFFVAVKIELPSLTLRYLDGQGELDVEGDGETFLGQDPSYGGIGAIETFSDGVDDQAPRVRITINVPGTNSALNLTNPNKQGSPVSMWWGVVDAPTGLVIGKELIFSGSMDVAVLRPGRALRAVEIDCASDWDRLLDSDDGARLNNAWEQLVWPGDDGLEFVTRLIKPVEWGSQTAGSGGVTYGGGGGGLLA